MSRLESVARGGFYPIAPAVTDLIASYLAAPTGGRIYDPYAGEGIALAQLAQQMGLEPYGSELNVERAASAETHVQSLRSSLSLTHHDPLHTRVLQADARQMQITRGSFNLLYANPPFDHDPQDQRLELALLKAVRPTLMPGGVLVWIIPQQILAIKRVAEYVAAWFDNLTIRRFPDGHNRFREAVVMGIGRRSLRQADEQQVAQILEAGRIGDSLQALAAAETPLYELPPLVVPFSKLRFLPRRLPVAQVLAEAERFGVVATPDFADHTQPPQGVLEFQPLTPLRQGHLVNIIAAGYLNNHLLRNAETGETVFIKGLTYKDQRVQAFEELEGDDETVVQVTKITDYFDTTITILRPCGAVEQIVGEAVAPFLQQWLSVLTEIVTKRFQPAYRFNLNGYEQTLGELNQGRIIPNTNRRGLAPAQQHAVAAAAMRLDKRYLDQKDAIIVGEMGVGKTVCGAAVPLCIGAKRVLILCPPHLVKKWEREIRHVVPNVRVMHLKTITDVDDFFADGKLAADAPTLFGVMKETSARAASGWRHAYDWCGPVNQKWLKRGQKVKGLDIEISSSLLRAVWGKSFDLEDDPNQTIALEIAGQTHVVRVAKLLDYLQAKRLPRGVLSANPIMYNDRPIRPTDFRNHQRFEWGADGRRHPLFYYDRNRGKNDHPTGIRHALQRQTAIQQRIRAGVKPYGSVSRRQLAISSTPSNKPASHSYSTSSSLSSAFIPHPSSFSSARWPLATYIKQRYKGQIDLLVADECHQFKGHDSDRGYAFGRLVAASKKVLGLTGTIFGGKASTLFSLLYRISHSIKSEYGHKSIQRWVRRYGIEQETIKERESSGVQSGNKRRTKTVKELPGASPAMVAWLLDRSVFVSLSDMGFALPDYSEEPVTLAMSPPMREMYRSLEQQLLSQIRTLLARGDRTLLAAYLQALLSWPDSPWRPKVVRHPRTEEVVAQIPGLSIPLGVAPKERAIVDYVKAELQQRRRVLLLCQQTETLDITPQWVQLLKQHNVRAAVLKVEPNKREAWIAQQEEIGTQVIISHPRRIATGLDIIGYPSVVWIGQEWSVYTTKQVNRRPYRITQTRAVKVKFFAYRNTLQEHALRLIAAKMAATNRIDGNLVSSDSLADFDNESQSDLVTTLAKMLTEQAGDGSVQSLHAAFADANAQAAQRNGFLGGYTLADDVAEQVVLHGVADTTVTARVNGPSDLLNPAVKDSDLANGLNGHDVPIKQALLMQSETEQDTAAVDTIAPATLFELLAQHNQQNIRSVK